MTQKKVKVQIFIIILIFTVYFFVAARPVPRETILTPKWINSLETNDPIYISKEISREETAAAHLFPFTIGYHFGYIDSAGQFAVNRIKSGEIYLSENSWTEYSAEPASIEIFNIAGDTIRNIENTRGYPILLDNRVFILGSEQNSLSEIGNDGSVLWSYEFGSILTCIDAAAGLVVTGSVDGVIEILDRDGKRVYFHQPGGSRLEVICGAAISANGSRIGIISGLDQQRFLLLEKSASEVDEYRVIYHEFLGTGFRRSVFISFIDEDSRVVFERQGGISCYNIKSRKSIFIPLDGELAAVDNSGDKGRLFLITRYAKNDPARRELIGIKLPKDRSFTRVNDNPVFLKAPFKSEDIYLGRKRGAESSMLIVGGGAALIAFDMEER